MSIVIKPFQMATASAVMQGLHRPDGEGRFLVADEVGLGKTVVAQGVIAEMLARHGKLTVFYIANGRRVASQNAKRLIPDKKTLPMIADRLGLLHQQRTFQNRKRGTLELYTFTPETSLKIRGTGRWEERAFLRQLLRMAFTKRAADVVVEPRRKDGWEQQSAQYARRHIPSKKLARIFRRVLKLRYGNDPVSFLKQQNSLHPSRITVLLRRAVAEAELQMNAPDLIIFDEFQNYRRLLFSRPSYGNEEEKRLIDRMLAPLPPTARPKVLLLSATPFRIYATQWQESQDPGHMREIFDLVRFLGGERVETDIRSKFPEFSKALHEFATVSEERVAESYARAEGKRDSLERSLKRIMCRTERKSSLANRPVVPESPIALKAQDFATFRHLARVLGAGTESRHRHEAVAFWSSVPLAAQVLGPSYVGWKAGRKRLRRISPGPNLRGNDPARGDEALTAHPKLRKLYRINPPSAAALPWVAPSQPWWPIGKAWQTPEGSVLGPEKLLLFSHFRATPQGIAALSSLASEQSAGKQAQSKRRQFNPRADRMAIFALFQPMTWLIQTADPAAAAGGTFADIRKTVRKQLEAALRKADVSLDRDQSRRPFWRVLAGLEIRFGAQERTVAAWWSSGIAEDAVKTCLRAWREAKPLESMSKREFNELVDFALEAPGVVAGRAIYRHDPAIVESGLKSLICLCWNGLRTYFDDPVFLSSRHYRGKTAAGVVRRLVCDGGLEAVLDEHICYAMKTGAAEGAAVATELMEALQVRAGMVTFHRLGRSNRKPTFRVRCHAAMAFGTTDRDAMAVDGKQKVSRSDALRVAFNTPFRPFILATTSVGQEGLDFHPWCDRVAHWDLCASPLDLEQREGRIQRFLGLNVRKQLARDFGEAALTECASTDRPSSPWRGILSRAEDGSKNTDGMSPWWVIPGAQVRSYLFNMGNSRDRLRYENLSAQRALYRLALGQPNQEDFLRTLISASPDRKELLTKLNLNLSPSQILDRS